MKLAIDNHLGRAFDRHCFEQIVTRSSEAVVVLDARDEVHPIVYINPAFEALTGYAASEIVGLPWRLLERDHSGEPELERLRAAVDTAEEVEVRLPDVRKDGTVCNSWIRFSPLYDDDDGVRYLLFLQREAFDEEKDFSATEVGALSRELVRAQQKANKSRRLDPITGLLRYEHFVDVVNRDLGVARSERKPISIMLFDVTELDAYRDTFGDKAAESCMRMVAGQITGSLRRTGELCTRRGASTFAAFVVGQDLVAARGLMARITENVLGLKLHNPRASQCRFVTVSSAFHNGLAKLDDGAEGLIAKVAQGLAEASESEIRELVACND